MILDFQTLLSNDQAVTVNNTRSTNTIDLGALQVPTHAPAAFDRSLAKGSPLKFRALITETFVGDFTNLVVTVRMSNSTTFSSAVNLRSQTVALANAVAGLVLDFDYFPELPSAQLRYLEMIYQLSGGAGTATAGRITAGFVLGHQEWFR